MAARGRHSGGEPRGREVAVPAVVTAKAVVLESECGDGESGSGQESSSGGSGGGSGGGGGDGTSGVRGQYVRECGGGGAW